MFAVCRFILRPLMLTVGNGQADSGTSFRHTVDGRHRCQSHDRHGLVRRINNVQVMTVLPPTHLLFVDRNDGSPGLGGLMIVGHESAFDLPTQPFNAVSGKQETLLKKKKCPAGHFKAIWRVIGQNSISKRKKVTVHTVTS